MLSAFPAGWFIDSARPGKQVLEFIPGSIKVRCTPAHTPRSMITPPPFDPAQNDGPHGSCRWRDRGSGEEWTWKPGKQTPRAKDAQKLRKQAADRFGLERRERARAQQAQSSVEHSAAVAATPSTTTARTPGTPAEHAVRYESPETTAKVC